RICCQHVAKGGFHGQQAQSHRPCAEALPAARSGKHYDVMDAMVPGFGVRVSDTGRRTFILVKRFPGGRNPTRLALAEFGRLSLERARSTARDWLELIRAGHPKDQEARQRVAEERKRANSFRVVAEDFIKLAALKQRKGGEVKRDIEREFIARWNGRPITDIA